MVNTGVMMKLATADQLPPTMLYLPVSNLTGPLLQRNGCVHNTNARQRCKQITLEHNQQRRLGFYVCVCSSDQAPWPVYVNQGCLTEVAEIEALDKRTVVL